MKTNNKQQTTNLITFKFLAIFIMMAFFNFAKADLPYLQLRSEFIQDYNPCNNKITLNVENLNNGVYFIINGKKVDKFIKE